MRISSLGLFLILLFPASSAIRWIGLWRVRNLSRKSAIVSYNSSDVSSVKSIPIESVKKWSNRNRTSLGCAAARRGGYLVGRQTKLCRKNSDVMPYVVLASLATIRVCLDTFADHRWNCSTLNYAPDFATDLTEGSREQSFVYALSSASVSREVARACSGGFVSGCGCGRTPREPPSGAFKWGGCPDNLHFGTRFARSFVDAHPYKTTINNKEVLSRVNRHNNKAGRNTLKDSVETACKCHGVSGSCAVRSCWQALPSLMEIGQRLKRKYQSAIEVALITDTLVSRGAKLAPVNVRLKTELPPDQLIFNAKSPDYCYEDKTIGSLGTRGRSCNESSSGTDGCDSMCCGRGYDGFTIRKLERCHCKYYWCCYVKCKTCEKWIQTFRCK